MKTQSQDQSQAPIQPQIQTKASIQSFSDAKLVQTTEGMVKEERTLLLSLLRLFHEIERRRLFSDYRYGSLHKMLVGHFGYSDDEAYRRTSAMRLLTELPEVAPRVAKGELSLSHLSLAKTYFNQEQKHTQSPVTKQEKLKLIERICDQSLREAQRIVLSVSSAPEQLRPDRVLVVSENKTELRFLVDRKVEEKIVELKGLLAHQFKDMSTGELFEKLCDLGIDTWRARKSNTTGVRTPSAAFGESSKVRDHAADGTDELSSAKINRISNSNSHSTATHRKPGVKPSMAGIRREVWRSAEFQCCQCNSKQALEVDHIYPKAKGGEDSSQNLRILCRACNQRSAIKHFGQEKMQSYFGELALKS